MIFGATGMVGKELVYELLENKNYLKITTVTRRQLPVTNSKLTQIVIPDLTQINQHSDKLNAHTYFCCIGTTIKKAGSKEAFLNVDLELPVSIANLAGSLEVPNLVVISSVGANANSSNFYLRTKGEMEKQVQGIYSKGNLKFLRPSLLLGHRDEFRFGEKIATYVMKFLGIFMIGKLKRYKGVLSWDVARAMVTAADIPGNVQVIESEEIHNLALQQVAAKKP